MKERGEMCRFAMYTSSTVQTYRHGFVSLSLFHSSKQTEASPRFADNDDDAEVETEQRVLSIFNHLTPIHCSSSSSRFAA